MMLRKLLPITLLPLFTCFGFKTLHFNNVYYSGVLNGKTIRLKLTNGFAGGSGIQVGNVTYYANSGHPAANNSMIYQSRYIQNIEYFVLNNIQDSYSTLPNVITGKYYRGRRAVGIRFKLDK